MGSLRKPIKTQLSEKQNFFFNFFLRALNVDQDLNILKKTDERHSLGIFENTVCGIRGSINV